MGGSFSWLPAHGPAPLKALMGAFPMPWPGWALGLGLHLPHLPVPAPGPPHPHSHCLESGVTFSMSSMKFFRNSVLLSEAFRSLQYSLGAEGGQEEWAWGAGRGRGSRLPSRSSRSFAGQPGLWVGRCVLTGCSRSGPGGLPGLRGGRADRMGVYFLHPGRFSLLDMALQSLPPLLRIWTRMEHGEALRWLPT